MSGIAIECDYCLTEEVCKGCPVVGWCAHVPGHGHGEEYRRFLKRIGTTQAGKKKRGPSKP